MQKITSHCVTLTYILLRVKLNICNRYIKFSQVVANKPEYICYILQEEAQSYTHISCVNVDIKHLVISQEFVIWLGLDVIICVAFSFIFCGAELVD